MAEDLLVGCSAALRTAFAMYIIWEKKSLHCLEMHPLNHCLVIGMFKQDLEAKTCLPFKVNCMYHLK